MRQKIANLMSQLPLFWKIFFSAIIGLAILALLAYSLWQQFFADTLIAWAPDNTVFYAHLSIPQYRDNSAYDKLADSLLSQTGVSSATDDIIRRELAFVYFSDGGAYRPLIFLRAGSPDIMEKILKEKKLGYRRLNRESFAIGQPEIVNSLIKNPKNRLFVKTKNKFSAWSTLYLYGEKQFVTAWLQDSSADYWQYVLLELSGGDDLYFNLFSDKEKNWGWLGQLAGRKKITQQIPDDKDLIFNLSGAGKISTALLAGNLPAELSQSLAEANYAYGINLINLPIKELSMNNISGSVKNKNTTGTGWFWADNEILLTISGQMNDGKIKALETIMKNILARQKPQDKKIQLHDGSTITERVLNPEAIKFSSTDGVLASNPDLPVRIFYRTSTEGMKFSNNRGLLLATSTDSYDNGFISLKTSLLNGRGFWNYIELFKTLSVYSNGQIILK